MQLESIEKSIAYVRSRALILVTPAEVARDLDAVLVQVSTVSAFESEAERATQIGA